MFFFQQVMITFALDNNIMSRYGTMKPFFLSSVLVAIAMLFAPVNASPQSVALRHGLSVTYEYLPARYPYYHYDTMEYNSTTVNGQGLGLDYSFSIPMPLDNFEFRTGLGFSYIRIDDSGVKDLFYFYSEYNKSLIEFLADYSIERSYCYAYLPVGLGYKIAIKEKIHITPFVGLRAKYNISYTEKQAVESASFYDLYYDLFDEQQVKAEDAKRFIFQAESGLELGFRKTFVSFSYSRDMSRFFKRVTFMNKGVNGPYTFNCWQAGIGVYF